MRRRDVLKLAGCSLPVLAQQPYPGTNYREYPKILPDHLRGLAGAAYRKRNAALLQVTNPAAAKERARWCRRTFWDLIGGEPDRTPLNSRITGSFEREGYKVEKVVYESRPGLHIPGNLYIPSNRKPPFPGVLFQLGHSVIGKSEPVYQKCCQGLARLGYLVLAFDTMGQGERTYYPRVNGTTTRLDSADEEHSRPGRQMLLFGDTSSRMQTWDAVRSLDYLAAHPLVDPKRLATTGNSGGGTISMMLACVDDRLAAAVISCPNTENFACADFNPPGSTDDAEQNFIGSGPLGFDRWDLLYPFAPKPLLVLVSAKDSFGTYSPSYISSGWEEFQKLQKSYTVLGKRDNLEWADTPLPHGLAHYMRLKIYDFFGRHLKSPAAPVREEPVVEPEPDRTLWVSESGNVVRSLGGKTPFDRLQRPVESRAGSLRELLGVPKTLGVPTLRRLGRVPSTAAVDVEAIDIATAPGVFVPAWVFVPRQTNPSKPVLLITEPQGRNSRASEDGMYHDLAKTGCLVCAVDVRGAGDLAPEAGRGSPRYTLPHTKEEQYAWGSLMLGTPLAGQRALDLAQTATALKAYPSTAGRRVVICASGTMTVPALFAASLTAAIDQLFLSGGLVSFESIATTEDYRYPFANFVPRLLLHTDLPAIARNLAPRKISLAGVIDANGRALSSDEIRSQYSEANNVEVAAQSNWTVAALSAL